MLYSELYGRLVMLTKRSDITHVEIGACINLSKGAITARAKRNTRMKPTEIEQIEKYFNVNISQLKIKEYSFEKQDDAEIEKKAEGFNKRLKKLQDRANLSDIEISGILNMDEDEYVEYKEGARKANIKIVNGIKKNFNISADWLLYGED